MSDGVKFDTGKRRWSLLPWGPLGAVVDVLEFGARKYAVDNWQRVPDARARYADAAMRHTVALLDGERTDPESGLRHGAHAVACLLFLMWFDARDDDAAHGATMRRGSWQQTYTGRQFWPLDPRPEDIDVRDIAHALALQCRFAGHCRQPYSVAEHSVRVSFVAEKAYRGYHEHTRNGEAVIRTYTLAALLHDASEAYCVDVPRPLKPYLTGYKDIERLVTDAVERWANIPAGACEEWNIKHADEVLLATEARDLMCAPPASWDLRVDPLQEIIEPWGWERAEREFLARYELLKGELRG